MCVGSGRPSSKHEKWGITVKKDDILATLLCLLAFAMAASSGSVRADGPGPSSATVPAPAMPADLARQVQEITDAVLEHHIDPPARQQMVLSGIKAMYRAAGVAGPPGLGRRASAVLTPEQLATLLNEVWPKTTAKPVAEKALEDALLEGLVAAVPGDTELMTAKDARVAEQMAGNRYVGIHITLGMDAKEQRPMIPSVFQGGPAGRAGIQAGAIIEEIDGADTKGMKLREAVDRLRGDDGTDVTVKIRQPKETKSRTFKITRGQLPRTTIVGFGASPADEGKLRLGVADPIGYLKITEITASTPHELRKLAQQMESDGIRALVLDLRGIRSGGSAMHPAVLLADSLLERGAIGRVRTARARRPTRPTPMPCSAAGRSLCSSIRAPRARRNGSRRPSRTITGPQSSAGRQPAPPSSARRPRYLAGGGCVADGRRGRRESNGPRRRWSMVDLDGDRHPRARRRATPDRSGRYRSGRLLGT